MPATCHSARTVQRKPLRDLGTAHLNHLTVKVKLSREGRGRQSHLLEPSVRKLERGGQASPRPSPDLAGPQRAWFGVAWASLASEIRCGEDELDGGPDAGLGLQAPLCPERLGLHH